MLRPEPSSRHPLVFFLLALSFFAGLSYLNDTRPPASIEQKLSPFAVQMWAAGLLVGGALGVIGLLLQGSKRSRPFHYGVMCELVSVSALWAPAIIYTVAAFQAVGLTAVGPAGVIGAFGVACFWRMVSLIIQMIRAQHVVDSTKGVVGDGAG